MAKKGRPSKFKEEYIEKAIEYAYKDALPSVEGLAIKLKVVKSSLYEWAKRNEDFSNALKVIKQNYQQKLIIGGLTGDYNSAFAKFLLSAQHGLTETSNIDHTSNGKDLDLSVNFNQVPSSDYKPKDD